MANDSKGKILSRKPGLTVAELAGSPHEIGLAHGRLFGPEIALMRTRLHRYLSDISFGVGGRALMWYFGRLARRMEPYVPEPLRQEMMGIAEGSGQPYGFILLMNSLDDVFVNLACSAFALGPKRTKTGSVIVGRNLDYPLFTDLLPGLATVLKVRPDTGRAFVSVAWPGFAAVVTGLNSEGVFLADLTSISKDRTLRGTPALLLNRAALQSADGLDRLEGIYRAAPRTVGKNVLAATGDGARVLELSASGISVRDMEDGLASCTNHFSNPGMARNQGSVKPPPRTEFPQSYYSYEFSAERLETVRSRVSGGLMGVEDAWAALRAEPVANRSTVQSVVCEPAKGRLLVAVRRSTPVSLGEFEEV